MILHKYELYKQTISLSIIKSVGDIPLHSDLLVLPSIVQHVYLFHAELIYHLALVLYILLSPLRKLDSPLAHLLSFILFYFSTV